MIELLLPADVPVSALERVRQVIRKHQYEEGIFGVPVVLIVGERRVELGAAYRVDNTPECLVDLMGVLDAFQ